YVVPTGRVVVPTGRYVVPTGRVVVPTGRVISPDRIPTGWYVVPTGRVVVPTSRVISPGRIPTEESIDSGFAMFNTIITSLKALDEGFSSKHYVRKFLRALHPKWRAKVVKVKQEKKKTETKPDKNEKRGKARQCKSPLTVKKAKKEKKILTKGTNYANPKSCIHSRNKTRADIVIFPKMNHKGYFCQLVKVMLHKDWCIPSFTLFQSPCILHILAAGHECYKSPLA
nr:zf-CCHC domain-containing protein/UBN2 domain-containing protein [Tanacetum cinerariifolium]